jgi:hypothetical protein
MGICGSKTSATPTPATKTAPPSADGTMLARNANASKTAAGPTPAATATTHQPSELKAGEGEATQNSAMSDSRGAADAPAVGGAPQASSGGTADEAPVKMSAAPMTGAPQQAPSESPVVVAVEVASSKPEPMAGSTGIPPATPAPEARAAETSSLEETAKGDMAEAPAVNADVKQKAEGKSEETEDPGEESAPARDLASPGAPAASQDCKWWCSA